MSVPPSVLARLKRRKLVQWGATYLAGVWLLPQIPGLLTNAFHWPDAMQQGASVLLAVGSIGALVSCLDLSRGHDLAYFSGGLAEELLNVLGPSRNGFTWWRIVER